MAGAYFYAAEWGPPRARPETLHIKPSSPDPVMEDENDMNIKPLGDRVLVRRLEEETRSKGGIIIPDTAKEKPMRGEIVAAGPGERTKDGGRRPMAVADGDVVIFGKYSGTEVKVGGEEFLLIREDEIFAKIS